MIRIPRWLVASLAILFAGFHGTLGVANLRLESNQGLGILALAIYAATAIPTMIFYRGLRLPTAQAILNLFAAAMVPLLVNSYLKPQDMSSYSTWYVMGIATLMSATAVRQQKAIAWLGTVILFVQVFSWAGFTGGIQTGLPGALMLVFAGHAISTGLSKAYRETMAFNQEVLEIKKQRIANAVASEVRRSRAENALNGALPMLNLIVSKGGKLTAAQRKDAKLLEASLRDEIRGRGFMSDQIRRSVRKARERGVEVTILDEGGLDSASDAERLVILRKASSAINKVNEGRITLRAPEGESWRATLVATRPGVATPDVWLKF